MPRVTISAEDKNPQPYSFELEREIINIGRGDDNDIVIDSTSISTHHSVMERVEGGYILRDIGSTNGIKQEDTLMDVIDLYDGMEVKVGDTPLKFQLSDEEIQQLSTEDYTPHQQQKLAEAPQEEDSPSAPEEPDLAEEIQPTPLRSQPAQASVSAGMHPILVLLLMAAAIFGGMTLRHQQDHQEFLFSSSEKEVAPAADQAADDIDALSE